MIEESNKHFGTGFSKPEYLLMDNIRKLQKYREKMLLPEPERDISHRRFSTTLFPSQILTAFKKGVHKGEFDKDSLITVYRVVASQIFKDDDVTDKDIITMHNHIRAKVSEVYERRAKRLRKNVK